MMDGGAGVVAVDRVAACGVGACGVVCVVGNGVTVIVVGIC